ncbi:PEP-CTERM sorting domain-containing protein [Pelomonas sp. KK5]|uniref:PEP-CTERM sorting domain-containing protein n=1 Tax=Pelomonas sp. KK5 TaxID=1855730 RepID=UPI001301DFDC|nr:PEP-CTERM sorting domain-containing protein [Pelomonas sp. KK5]
MKFLCSAMAALAIAAVASPAAAVTASFDDLATPPPVTTSTGLFFANGDSSLYQGIVWDSRFVVVGDEARVDTATPGPLFGIPHSGHYFVTNEGDGASNDGLLITTSMLLTGAWFARNEYYGFGAGADQVTINAMQGSTVLMSVVFDLPAPAVAGEPGQPAFADTSAFAAVASSITGYRIDRHELGTLNGNWVADDFIFAAVPEPATAGSLLAGLVLVSAWLRRASSGSPGRSGRRP